MIMDPTEQGLISPPQIPTSLMMNQGDNKELFLIFAEIINSEKTMYRNILRLYYSADYIEDTEYTEIQDEEGNIQKIPTTKSKVVKLPSADKICPACKKVFKSKGSVELGDIFCDQEVHKGKTHNDGTPVSAPKLEYLNWSPIFNENGFNKLMSLVFMGTDQIMSTGSINLPGETDKDEKIPLKEMAIRGAAANLSAITENTFEWSATGKQELTRGMYSSIANSICDHYFFTMTRSKGKENLLYHMAQTSRVVYNNPSEHPGQRKEETQSKGIFSMLFGGGNK